MGSVISARAIVTAAGLAGVLTLAACTSAPPKPGQSIAEIGAAQDKAFRRPAFAFQNGTHRIALYHDDRDILSVQSATMLVFEDDRYLCWLHSDTALDFSACLAQPDGLAQLADRLHSLCTFPTVVKMHCPTGTEALHPIVKATNEQAEPAPKCPLPVNKATDEQTEPGSKGPIGYFKYYVTGAVLGIGTFVVGVAYLTVWYVVAVMPVIVSSPFLVYTGVENLHDHPSLVAQQELRLGMTATDAAEIMGEPTTTFFLEPAHTEVRYFERSAQLPLWIGFTDNHLIWLRYTNIDNWLGAVTTRSLKVAETRP
jgi:hypothetical protein